MMTFDRISSGSTTGQSSIEGLNAPRTCSLQKSDVDKVTTINTQDTDTPGVAWHFAVVLPRPCAVASLGTVGKYVHVFDYFVYLAQSDNI